MNEPAGTLSWTAAAWRASGRVLAVALAVALVLADRGVLWSALGLLVLATNLAYPGAWWHYVRTGQHPPTGPDPAYTEGGTADVVLRDGGPRRIRVVKAVREATGAGLLQAKVTVEGAPSTVAAGLSEASALLVVQRLRRAGADAEVVQGRGGQEP